MTRVLRGKEAINMCFTQKIYIVLGKKTKNAI